MGRILSALRADKRKGRLLEEVVACALRDLGFTRVSIQGGGSQYGRDITATRPSPDDGLDEVWFFECKNLAEAMTLDDLAPKLVWHWGRTTIDRFVIVGTSELSNDLRHWLEDHELPMPISIWSGDTLESILETCPGALRRLGITTRPPKTQLARQANLLGNVFEPQAPIVLDVVHKEDPPASIDYVQTANGMLKCYASSAFTLYAIASRRRQIDAKILSMVVQTTRYAKAERRVLRVSKPKGLFEAPRVQFTPSSTPGASVDLLGKRVWPIDSSNKNLVEIALAGEPARGVYDLRLLARCHVASREHRLASATFPVNVLDESGDHLQMIGHGRHYASAAAAVLGAPKAIWEKLKVETRRDDQIVVLGPAWYEARPAVTAKTWSVRAYRLERHADGTSNMALDGVPRLLWDSKRRIDEELFSEEIAYARLTGKDPWQQVLPAQLERRARSRAE